MSGLEEPLSRTKAKPSRPSKTGVCSGGRKEEVEKAGAKSENDCSSV